MAGYTQKEIKIWCQKWGYTFEKIKTIDPETNTESSIYRWTKPGTDPIATGDATSLSKFVRQVYNHMTDNKWVEHQQQYAERMSKGEIDYEKGLY